MMGLKIEKEIPRPLTMELETAKGIILTAVNRAKAECGIPNFIMEGIIADIHSQVTSQSKVEMINDFNAYLEELKKDEEKQEGKGEE